MFHTDLLRRSVNVLGRVALDVVLELPLKEHPLPALTILLHIADLPMRLTALLPVFLIINERSSDTAMISGRFTYIHT